MKSPGCVYPRRRCKGRGTLSAGARGSGEIMTRSSTAADAGTMCNSCYAIMGGLFAPRPRSLTIRKGSGRQNPGRFCEGGRDDQDQAMISRSNLAATSCLSLAFRPGSPSVPSPGSPPRPRCRPAPEPLRRRSSSIATCGRSCPTTASCATVRTRAVARPSLRLDVRADAIKSKALVPGKPGESSLVERILSDDAERTDAAAEVEQEADQPAEGDSQALARTGGGVSAALVLRAAASRRKSPPGRMPWTCWWCEGWRKSGSKPSPEADRRTLIRRLRSDLVGLPPSPEEVRAFVDDPIARSLRATGRSTCWQARITANAWR